MEEMRGTTFVVAFVLVMLVTGEARGEAQLNRITEVQLEEDAGRSTLTIAGSLSPEYTITSRSLPSRLIVELSNARTEGLSPRLSSRTPQIAEVALGARYVEGEIATRVFVYLRGTVAYQVQVQNNVLVMSFVSVSAEDMPNSAPTAIPSRVAIVSSEEQPMAQVQQSEDAPRTVSQQGVHPSEAGEGEENSRRGSTEAEAGRVHIVQPGEVISRIAARHGVSIQDLIGWNPDVNPDRIGAGQRLVIRGQGPSRHRVRPGEVISAIASRYGTTIENLVSWNPGLNPDRIRVGSTLVVHDPSSR